MDHLHEQIEERMKEFDPISLEEMDGVKLLNRMDTKYTFNIGLLPQLLTEIKDTYRILIVGEKRCSQYETLYYDTPDFKFYTWHHNGRANRFKVRIRRYVDSELNYFEIKFKNNKKRTIKKRVKRTQFSEEIEGKSSQLLQNFTAMDGDALVPKLWVYFNRMTFVSRQLNERLTIDTGINYVLGDKKVSYPGVVIAEVKQDRSLQSSFISVMQKHRMNKMSISKYCLGIASLIDTIKKNNFKVRLNIINRINHDIT